MLLGRLGMENLVTEFHACEMHCRERKIAQSKEVLKFAE